MCDQNNALPMLNVFHSDFSLLCENTLVSDSSSLTLLDAKEIHTRLLHLCTQLDRVVQAEVGADIEAVFMISCAGSKSDAILMFLAIQSLPAAFPDRWKSGKAVPFFVDVSDFAMKALVLQSREPPTEHFLIFQLQRKPPFPVPGFRKLPATQWCISHMSRITSSHPFLPSLGSYPPLSYITTTSGSTGAPTLVHVPHCSIQKNVDDFIDLFRLSPLDRIINVAPLTFDPAVLDILCAIQIRGILIIAEVQTVQQIELLANLVHMAKPTFMQITPTLLFRYGSLHLRRKFHDSLLMSKTFRILLLGGEPIASMDDLEQFLMGDVEVYNVYGITEVSCWAFVNRILLESPVQEQHLVLGKPLSGIMFQLEQTAEGYEILFLGGEQRRCYLDLETSSQELIWRSTRDYVSRSTRNSVEQLKFEGRLDSVVKRCGRKLHLERLENFTEKLLQKSLKRHSPSQGARGAVRGITCVANVTGGKDLTLKIYNDQELTLEAEITAWLRNQIRRELGDVYIPGQVFFEGTGANDQQGVHLSRSLKLCRAVSIEYRVKKIWSNILGTPCAGNFIREGGNSMLALAFVEDLKEEFSDLVSSNNQLPELLDYVLNKEVEDVIRFIETTCLRSHQALSRPLTLAATDSRESGHDEDLPVLKRTADERMSDGELPLLKKTRNEKGNDEDLPVLKRTADEGMSDSDLPLSKNNERIVWKHSLAACIDASPVVSPCTEVKGTGPALVFVGSHSGLFGCYHVSTGSKVWEVDLKDRIIASACVVNIKSREVQLVLSPVYNGELHAFESTTGKQIWMWDAAANVTTSPVFDPGTELVLTTSHKPALTALSLVEPFPKVEWEIRLAARVSAKPLIHNSLVFFADVAGTALCVSLKCGSRVWQMKGTEPIFANPCLIVESSYKKALVVFASVQGRVICRSAADGTILWSTTISTGIFSSPFRLGNHILIASQQKLLHFLSLKDGSKSLPILKLPGPVSTASLCWDTVTDLLYVADITGNIVTFHLPLADQCVPTNWTTEILLQLPAPIFASPVLCSPMLLVGCRDDFLYAISCRRP